MRQEDINATMKPLGGKDASIEAKDAEIAKLGKALDFIIELAEEEYGYCNVGTGAEVALRHIIRRAREARGA